MKVSELIEELQKHEPDAIVEHDDPMGDYVWGVDFVAAVPETEEGHVLDGEDSFRVLLSGDMQTRVP